MYENAGTRQPEPLHAEYVEDVLWLKRSSIQNSVVLIVLTSLKLRTAALHCQLFVFLSVSA